MKRLYIEKGIISLALAAVFFFVPLVGYVSCDTIATNWTGHLFYSFSHANIWHLMGNIICLWSIKGRFKWFSDYLIAVLASFLPSLTSMPVCGFSCVIFAEIGRRFGVYAGKTSLQTGLWRMAKATWIAFAIGVFVPNIAVFPHLWAMIGGFLVVEGGRLKELLKWEVLYIILLMRKKVYGGN